MKSNDLMTAIIAALFGSAACPTLIDNPKEVISKVGKLMKTLDEASDKVDTTDLEYPLEVMFMAAKSARHEIRELANYYRSLSENIPTLREITHRHEADIYARNLQTAKEAGVGYHVEQLHGEGTLEKMVELSLKVSIIGSSVKHHKMARLDFIAMNCMLAVIDMDEMLNGKTVTAFNFSDN